MTGVTAGSAILFTIPAIVGCTERVNSGEPAGERSVHAQTEASEGAAVITIQDADLRLSDSHRVQRVDFGTARGAERLRRELVIANSTSKPVVIDRFEASCDCLTVETVPVPVEAGAKSRLRIELDLSKESSFSGTLQINVFGYEGARRAIDFDVLVTVPRPVKPEARPSSSAEE